MDPSETGIPSPKAPARTPKLEGETDDDQIDEAWAYFSGGFQLTLSCTPEGGAEDHIDGAGPHIGITPGTAVADTKTKTAIAATKSRPFRPTGVGLANVTRTVRCPRDAR